MKLVLGIASGWMPHAALASVLSVGLMLAPTTSLRAQPFDPLADGFKVHVQAGFAWATLHGVEPIEGDISFGRRRVPNYSLRVSRVLIGPVSGFMEGGLAQRGAEISQPGEPTLGLRSRWYDAGLGVNVAARCFYQLCPSLDVGAVLGLHRESVLSNAQTGQLVGTLDVKSTESAAVIGVRVASARFRGIAAVIRHHEGLSELPEDGSKSRNRALSLMLSLPLGR